MVYRESMDQPTSNQQLQLNCDTIIAAPHPDKPAILQ